MGVRIGFMYRPIVVICRKYSGSSRLVSVKRDVNNHTLPGIPVQLLAHWRFRKSPTLCPIADWSAIRIETLNTLPTTRTTPAIRRDKSVNTFFVMTFQSDVPAILWDLGEEFPSLEENKLSARVIILTVFHSGKGALLG